MENCKGKLPSGQSQDSMAAFRALFPGRVVSCFGKVELNGLAQLSMTDNSLSGCLKAYNNILY